jgi:HK97 family phage prohead protease
MKSVHVRRLESRVERTAARIVEHAARLGLGVAELPSVKLPWYEIRASAPAPGGEPESATVFIFDEIGGSLGVSAKKFAQDLEEITAPLIKVRINSPGGSVFDSIAIFNALNHHAARIVSYVDGIAASGASVVAMAGDEIVMMPGSQMMIHDAGMVQEGNAAEMAKASTFLDRQSANIAEIYQMRAGGDANEWRDLMLAETWMFAREAVAIGLAHRVEELVEPDADGDPALAGMMTRSFDLGGFRYAGRREAPEPARRPTGIPRQQRSQEGVDVMSKTIPRSSTDAERRHAGQARADAAGDRPGAYAMAKRKAPAGVSQARTAAFPAQLRAKLVDYNGQQRYHVVGHASVVERPYEMWDTFGPYMEVIDRNAFTSTLAAGPDVAFLVNHRGITMARTTNDSLRLSMDDVGLAVEAWLNPKRQDVSDLVVAIEDGDITEMSFAFMLGDAGGTWSTDFQTFRVNEADLDRGDVSAVTYGANPYTDVAARSREVLRDLDHLPAGAAAAALVRLQQRCDLTRPVDEHVRRLESVGVMTISGDDQAQPTGRSLAHIEALLTEQ